MTFNLNIKYCFSSIGFLLFLIGSGLGSQETKSCFTSYPEVIVRDSPSLSGKKVHIIKQSTPLEILERSSTLEETKIRNRKVQSDWVKVSDGWIFGGLIRCIPKIFFAHPISYHEKELPFSPSDPTDWIAIYLQQEGYLRKQISIDLKREYDAVVNENEKIKTGYKVNAIDNPIVLIKGITFKKGNFPAISKKVPLELEFGKSYNFTFRKDSYRITSKGKPVQSSGINDYQLILRKNEKEMIIDSLVYRTEKPILVFAGDIDGDGELDFIFDLKDHYNVSNEYLYISSEKINDFFIVPVAANRNTGC
ncbi:SH3 domain-containing protein [Leptospira kirschneri]|uniref:SH3 domain-containing protein n=1 Tax=Leptospira kirschneri TaxID=29507 RepID=UPI0029553F46|nr:SH3 domain-containing protein [Leptospira kirschneri]